MFIQFYITKIDNLEIKNKKIVFFADPKSPKSKDVLKNKSGQKKFKNDIFDELVNSKLNDLINLKNPKKEESSLTEKLIENSILKEYTIDSKILNTYKNPTFEINNLDKETTRNNLSVNSNKISDSLSIHFKDEIRNAYKNNKNEKNNLISITTINTNSSISLNSLNSVRFIRKKENLNNKEQSIDKLETIEYQISNRFKEVNTSKGNILNNSIQADSRYFYDDISTKTINTCSIKDDDSESDEDLEI